MSQHLAFVPMLAQEGDVIAGIVALAVLAIVLLIGLAVLAIWVFAFVHAIINPRLTAGQKVLWLLVVFFGNMLGALLYLLLGRRPATAAPPAGQ